MASRHYRGNNGWKGALSYKATGIIYDITGIKSKKFGSLCYTLCFILLCIIITKFKGGL